MEDVSVDQTFLIATAAEKKRRSVNYDRKRRDVALELLKKKRKVTSILGNDQFRNELEGILKTQLGGGGQPRKPRQFHDISGEGSDTAKTFKNIPRRGSLHGGIAMANNVIPINDLRGVNASKYTIGERQLRCKLASLYRLMHWFGWAQSIYNHITVKTSQEKEHFLINPFGLLYSEITASNLVTVDIDGNIIDPGTTQLGCNQAGYVLHSAIHEGRPEIQCVIHTHTIPGMAVAAMKCGLLRICQDGIFGGVSYHDFYGIVIDEGEKEEIIRNLGPDNKVLILRNHGLVTLGSNIEEAFDLMFNLINACEVQVQALSYGIANLIHVSDEVSKRVCDVISQGGGGVSKNGKMWRRGELEFEAYMRMLDNLGYNTGYPYKGMEFLQPAEATKAPSTRQMERSRKAHQREKATTDGNPPVNLSSTTKEITTHEMKQSHLTDNGKTLSTVTERQEPAAVTVSPPSSAVDDAWDFLSNSPQKVVTAASNQPVRHASDGLWNFLDDDAVSPDMPARVANSGSSSGDSRRSSENEIDLSERLADTEKSSHVNVEQTARRVANSTSDAVRTLASKSEDPLLSLKATARTESISLQEGQSFSTDSNSSLTVQETEPPNDVAGLQKVMVTAERVAASTSGAVLKLGSSFHHQ